MWWWFHRLVITRKWKKVFTTVFPKTLRYSVWWDWYICNWNWNLLYLLHEKYRTTCISWDLLGLIGFGENMKPQNMNLFLGFWWILTGLQWLVLSSPGKLNMWIYWLILILYTFYLIYYNVICFSDFSIHVFQKCDYGSWVIAVG